MRFMKLSVVVAAVAGWCSLGSAAAKAAQTLRSGPRRPLRAAPPGAARVLRLSALAMLAAACGTYSSDGADYGSAASVGGEVRGLWDGAHGLVLRLRAGGVDESLPVASNGAFRFAQTLAYGAAYEVTVAASPARHTCVVAGGGSGTIAGADVGVSVSCTGPLAAIALSPGWNGTFDLARDEQIFTGSITVEDVAIVVTGEDLTDASVGGAPVTLGEATAAIPVPLGSTTILVALTASGGLTKTYRLVFDRGGSSLAQVVYGKASNTGEGDSLGAALSLSGDTLVVGAPNEASGANGVNGDQGNDRAPGAGAVYVFVRTGDTWTQQAYLKASNAAPRDGFGASVALSGDTLAVGAPLEDGSAAGIDGAQDDDRAPESGAVYVFVRTGVAWSQQAYLKASLPGAGDVFGQRVALSGDTLAVGAVGESSAATGIDGDETDDSAEVAGAVYVFERVDTTWTQQAYVKASNTRAFGEFGGALALSGDTLAVGAVGDASGATGIDGDQAGAGAQFSGAAYVFVRDGKSWIQQAYLKASNTEAFDLFGSSIALSGDTLAVGAPRESSAATGVDGDQAGAGAEISGAAYVFSRRSGTWTQQVYVKASNTGARDGFGTAVALAGDTLVVGANGEGSAATGVGGDEADDTAPFAGAVYAYARTGTAWRQAAYVKASNAGPFRAFGFSLALSSDTLVVGAPAEPSDATGIDPGSGGTDTRAPGSGAFYVFR